MTLCYKNYVTYMENREEIQLSLIIVCHYTLYCNEVDVKERLFRWQSDTVDNKSNIVLGGTSAFFLEGGTGAKFQKNGNLYVFRNESKFSGVNLGLAPYITIWFLVTKELISIYGCWRWLCNKFQHERA